VVIVGAGPVGLLLACELRRAGVAVTVLEQPAEPSTITKPLAMRARTVEILALRGLAGPFLDHGVRLPTWHFGFLATRVDFTGRDSPFPCVLTFPQDRTEALLESLARPWGADVSAASALENLGVTW
jgi:2-polyprenyl-6-methoxyphenol hydroxylase-like FAD-dependent oxidoreductase